MNHEGLDKPVAIVTTRRNLRVLVHLANEALKKAQAELDVPRGPKDEPGKWERSRASLEWHWDFWKDLFDQMELSEMRRPVNENPYRIKP